MTDPLINGYPRGPPNSPFPPPLHSSSPQVIIHNTILSNIHKHIYSATMTIDYLPQEDLDAIYAFAVDLGRRAGKLLMDRVEQRISGAAAQEFEEKENAVDIVTQTDEGEKS